jgi:hypothetical protein
MGGRIVVEPGYDFIEPFKNGIAKIEFNGKYGFIDSQGKEIISPQFEQALQFSEGLAGVSIKGKCGYIDKTGKLVIPAVFEAVCNFHQGLAAVKLNGKFGFIDSTGKIVITPQYPRASSFGLYEDGLAYIEEFSIDKTGEKIWIEPETMEDLEELFSNKQLNVGDESETAIGEAELKSFEDEKGA